MFNRQIKFDFLLVMAVLLLVVIGTTMIYSASNFKASEQFKDSNYFLKRQIIRVIVGFMLMIMFYFIDYRDLQKFAWVILIVSFLLLLFVLVGGIRMNGSRRAFNLLSFVFQPSEMAKYALIVFMSWFLAMKGKRIRDFNDGLLPALLIIIITVIPILLEPDLGTSVIIMTIAIIMLFVSGANLYHLGTLGMLAVGILTLMLANFKYQRTRLFSFIDTVRGVQDPPWQVLQSLVCFGNGGLTGLGLGNSKQKLHFLPQPFTDFIYAILGEELGFIGAGLIILLFLIILWRGAWIALNAPDQEGKLLAIGITSSLTIYAFVNIAITVNLLPITGITLPFISYGGSSLIMNFVGVGMLLNISRHQKRKTGYSYSYADKISSNNRYRTRLLKKRKKIAR